ncbi:MAG TPA: hypothetical protein VGN35_05820 [Jatrophihabitantaceae bacterium]|nr:hypothetical protein [Jatrophihabitantaceae bacterium]
MSSGTKYVTRIRLAPDGYRHEHIEEIEYHHGVVIPPYDSPELHYASVSVAALLLDEHDWDVRVSGAPETVRLRTVHPYGRPPYLRGFADDAPTNDLLDLPHY